MIDIGEKKSQILSHLKRTGPSLPVRLAKAAKIEPVLASAILSELLGDKKVKMSNMKVGTSSLYLLEGQENMLEKFSGELGSGQRNAFERLKKKKVLKDNDEEPAIRVALRSLRDFAIPFKFEESILWRYAFTPREEIQTILSRKEKGPQKRKVEEKPQEKMVEKQEKVEEDYDFYFVYKFGGLSSLEVDEGISKLEEKFGKGFVYLRNLAVPGESREKIISKFKEKIKDFQRLILV